ncbi:uncharacterized protein C16orf78 homolog isoform X3 [Ambystoma mexicanum]|uniref:uncharacterized protein C16orf78 homolog isoform X3 n=1 Tax=Ambystoma mexicanum TaxID=8296 RepID=UPI0037E7B34A
MSSAGRKKPGSVVIDWLDSRQAKTLRVTNERESFHRPSGMDYLSKQGAGAQPGSVQTSAGSAASLASDHLPKFGSFLRQPTKTVPIEQKKGKDFTPFSRVDLSMRATAPKPPDCLRAGSYAMQGRLPKLHNMYEKKSEAVKFKGRLKEQLKSKGSVSSGGSDVAMSGTTLNHPDILRSATNIMQENTRLHKKSTNAKKPSVADSSISLQEAIHIFPSLQRLSAVSGRNIPNDKIQLNKAMSGFPGFERRLKELLVKAWEEEERSQRAVSLPHIKPEEILRCRYLRLSQNNINTLLRLCKDSGMHVDIHPHMKESDIDVNTVMSSTNNTVSL